MPLWFNSSLALAADPVPRSGLDFASPATREMQADEFANPGRLWVEQGRALWREPAGAAGTSCASCHGDEAAAVATAGTRYPVFDAGRGRLVNLEQRINLCRVERMQAPALAWESEPLLALTTFVRSLSRGAPVSVAIDGPAAPFFARGRALFMQRLGLSNLSCAQCHEKSVGKLLRDDRISQGQSNGFPAYRLRWQTLGSLHRRLQACNAGVGAEPLPLGDDDYVALELYLAWRGAGLPVETPAVRR